MLSSFNLDIFFYCTKYGNKGHAIYTFKVTYIFFSFLSTCPF